MDREDLAVLYKALLCFLKLVPPPPPPHFYSFGHPSNVLRPWPLPKAFNMHSRRNPGPSIFVSSSNRNSFS